MCGLLCRKNKTYLRIKIKTPNQRSGFLCPGQDPEV